MLNKKQVKMRSREQNASEKIGCLYNKIQRKGSSLKLNKNNNKVVFVERQRAV